MRKSNVRKKLYLLLPGIKFDTIFTLVIHLDRPEQDAKVCEKMMKTIVKAWIQDGIATTSPSITITHQDLVSATNDPSLLDRIERGKRYADFCKNQTTKGKKRKSQRNNARRKIFRGVPEHVEEAYKNLHSSIREKKMAEIKQSLKSVEVAVEYDGRKANNLYEITKGVMMAVNIGGISPQYYGIGIAIFSHC